MKMMKYSVDDLRLRFVFQRKAKKPDAVWENVGFEELLTIIENYYTSVGLAMDDLVAGCELPTAFAWYRARIVVYADTEVVMHMQPGDSVGDIREAVKDGKVVSMDAPWKTPIDAIEEHEVL